MVLTTKEASYIIVLGIVISVLPISSTIWYASHELLDAIPIFEAWETQSDVFFLLHVVIVRLHALLVDTTLDIFILFTRHEWIVGIVWSVRLKASLSVPFPSLSNVLVQWSAGAWVYFRPRQRWRWFRLHVCDVVNVFKVGNRVHVCNRIFVSIGFTTLSRFNVSGGTVNSQIRLKVFRMV
jgi:hypothetical protein